MDAQLAMQQPDPQGLVHNSGITLNWNQLTTLMTPRQLALAQLLMGGDSASAATFPDLRPLVYTSFDGDHMRYMHWMCYVALSLGYVPINPEAALGSYLLNTKHAGSKIEVMRDCIALEMCCHEFWHFDAADTPLALHLAEGVLAELMMWRERKHSAPVRLFPWIESHISIKHLPKLMQDRREQTLQAARLSNKDLEHFLHQVEPTVRDDIDQRLLQTIRKQGMRPLVFLSQHYADFKHVDWARWTAYHSGHVPLCPDTLMEHFVLDLAHGSQATTRGWLDRLSILNAADELWLFHKLGRDLLNCEPVILPDEIAIDLYFWLRYKTGKPVRMFSWREADVPKYRQPRWAITTREHLQNVQLT